MNGAWTRAGFRACPRPPDGPAQCDPAHRRKRDCLRKSHDDPGTEGRFRSPLPRVMLARGMSSRQTVLILDYGSQYTQLIARRIRECHVYCEIHPGTIALAAIQKIAAAGHHL